MSMNYDLELCEFDDVFLAKSWIWLNDPYVNYFSDTGTITQKGQQRWFQHLKDRKDYLIWGVKFQNKPIGACGFKNIVDKQAEYWGYIGETSLYGRGIGYYMLSALLSKAKELGISRVVLKVLKENHRAINLYNKFFFKEYIRDEHYIYMHKIL